MLSSTRMIVPSIPPAVQSLPAPTPVSQVMTIPVVPQQTVAVVPQPLIEPIIQQAVQPVMQSFVQPIAPVAQSIIQPTVQPMTQSVIQPIVQTVPTPVVQPVMEQVIQPVVQPIAPPVVSQIVQPVVQPVAMPLPPMQQYIPQPVIPGPRPLTPSPNYDKFIPPTPMPSSLANDIPPKAYQFYQYVPVQQNVSTSMVNTLIPQGAAYSTNSVPVQNIGLSVGAPQYRTLTFI